MPPEAASKAWLLLYYDQPVWMFWQQFGAAVYEGIKSRLKVTDEIRRAAASITGDESSPDEKLRKIYDFCATTIKRIDDDASEMSAEAVSRLKTSKSPAETLARKMGTGRDIDFLFAALATAAGFESRYAMLGDRGRAFLNPKFPVPFLLTSFNIAVRVNNGWKFFDPAGTYLQYGMLRWQEEGIPALVIDPKVSTFVPTQSSPAGLSILKRTALFRLSDDGTLEGDVKIAFLGHFGAEAKESMDALPSAEREQSIRDRVRSQMSSAEVTNIEIENANAARAVITEAYHVRVPGYAQRTGTRLLFQPGYFMQGVPPAFSSSTRNHPVYFPYPWTETDSIAIELPPGFVLDNAEQPQPITVGTVAKQEIKIGISEDGRHLSYSRQFSFGLDNSIGFWADRYPLLKQAFDAFHENDNHTIAIRQKAADEERRP